MPAMLDELPFSEVWAVDFEFRPEDGREGRHGRLSLDAAHAREDT